MRINGKPVPASMPLGTDNAGRAMPRYLLRIYILEKPELLLMSDVSGTSFDGRYFGSVNLSQIKNMIRRSSRSDVGMISATIDKITLNSGATALPTFNT